LPTLLLPMTEGRELRALLRIFLDPDGHKARRLDKPKRTLGSTRGSIIEIGAPAAETMNLAEGFEDAESAMILRGLAGCAAVCGVERYHQITIPEHVRHVVIYSQHGPAATAGIERGRDNLTANRRSLDIVLPPARCDWNDALRRNLARHA
jgi:putative DNA primase/helicase